MKISLDKVGGQHFENNKNYLIFLKRVGVVSPSLLTIGRYNESCLKFEYYDYSDSSFREVSVFEKRLIHVFSLDNIVRLLEV